MRPSLVPYLLWISFALKTRHSDFQTDSYKSHLKHSFGFSHQPLKPPGYLLLHVLSFVMFFLCNDTITHLLAQESLITSLSYIPCLKHHQSFHLHIWNACQIRPLVTLVSIFTLTHITVITHLFHWHSLLTSPRASTLGLFNLLSTDQQVVLFQSQIITLLWSEQWIGFPHVTQNKIQSA